MRKPLSGKKWFYSQGQRYRSLGVKRVPSRYSYKILPLWAYNEFCRGWFGF